MGAREDCRHYVRRSTAGGDAIEQCKLAVSLTDPFGCPDDCLFHEARRISDVGFQRSSE